MWNSDQVVISHYAKYSVASRKQSICQQWVERLQNYVMQSLYSNSLVVEWASHYDGDIYIFALTNKPSCTLAKYTTEKHLFIYFKKQQHKTYRRIWLSPKLQCGKLYTQMNHKSMDHATSKYPIVITNNTGVFFCFVLMYSIH